MQILTVDVGTGTQDIFLYDARLDLENGFKLIVPSPTMIIHQKLKEATRRRQAVALTGFLMGGGPSAWAAEEHARQGLPTFATPEAARSFNDDLEAVREMGIKVLSEDEVGALPGSVQRVELRDFDFATIRRALGEFGVSLDQLAAVAVAVFDHGDSPPHYSDRQFRFDYLDERLRAVPPGLSSPLAAFAYRSGEVPRIMTRLQAVADSAQRDAVLLGDVPLIVMDTAPAAVWGATFDTQVAERLKEGQRVLIANVGNFHTLAFRLSPVETGSGYSVEGVFEHHTGLVDRQKLEGLLLGLANGELQHADVFNDHGHGALVYHPAPMLLDQPGWNVAVTGPRRAMLQPLTAGEHSTIRPYLAVPFGDMMIAGCFGLLAAAANLLPELREPVLSSLAGSGGAGTPPWEIL